MKNLFLLTLIVLAVVGCGNEVPEYNCDNFPTPSKIAHITNGTDSECWSLTGYKAPGGALPRRLIYFDFPSIFEKADQDLLWFTSVDIKEGGEMEMNATLYYKAWDHDNSGWVDYWLKLYPNGDNMACGVKIDFFDTKNLTGELVSPPSCQELWQWFLERQLPLALLTCHDTGMVYEPLTW